MGICQVGVFYFPGIDEYHSLLEIVAADKEESFTLQVYNK